MDVFDKLFGMSSIKFSAERNKSNSQSLVTSLSNFSPLFSLGSFHVSIKSRKIIARWETFSWPTFESAESLFHRDDQRVKLSGETTNLTWIARRLSARRKFNCLSSGFYFYHKKIFCATTELGKAVANRRKTEAEEARDFHTRTTSRENFTIFCDYLTLSLWKFSFCLSLDTSKRTRRKFASENSHKSAKITGHDVGQK